ASAMAEGAKAVRTAAVRAYGAAGDVVTLTGRQIRRKPVVATLTAIGAGFLIGFLIGRKTRGSSAHECKPAAQFTHELSDGMSAPPGGMR
ncbi:MAG: hypothetical protein KGL02_09075, partial [Acidobacteriota bacterium]|nr:hypothetical protein [Acidobacteriota bacterium]